MTYPINLVESLFPAQQDDAIIEQSIGDALRATASKYPDNMALMEADINGQLARQWRYGELLETVELLAYALASRFQKGERITIWAPNCPEWVIIEYACALAGIVVVTANPAYQAKELRYVLEQSGSVALFQVNEYRGNPMQQLAVTACEDLTAIREIVDIENSKALYHRNQSQQQAPNLQLPVVLPSDIAQIQYTSGTTGFPKGTVLAHSGLLNNARFYTSRARAHQKTIWINIMAMFHTSGCGSTVLGAMQFAACVITVRLFEPVSVCRLIEQCRVTMVLGVPTMFVSMLDYLDKHPHDLSSVESTSSGGAMVAPELVRRIKSTFGCHFGTIYGQTETYPVLTQHHHTDSDDDISNTIGQALPQTCLSIRSTEDNSVMPLNTSGEICVAGHFIMKGYHENLEATAATIDSDGWLHTGDLGSMDSRGYIKITGRVKEMIIRGGENLFPVEIENMLLEHPSIAEVAVAGIPDDKWGEVVACFFRSENDQLLNQTELHDYCRLHLSAQKTPSIWCQVTEFPLTGSGKIRRFKLRDNYLDGYYNDHL